MKIEVAYYDGDGELIVHLKDKTTIFLDEEDVKLLGTLI